MLRTVTGPVRAAAVTGAVLPHEHLRADMRWAVGIDSDPYRWLDEEQAVIAELRALRTGDDPLGLVVELTSIGMGRDAAALARIAAGSRVPVVAATGLSTGPFSGAADADADTLTGLLMADILDGMDDSGVFPGVIGEVGCWGAHPTPAEERALRAAARAALSSRLSVATYGQDGLAMLELLMIEGLPASRVSVGCSGADPAAARKIAESGAYVSLGSIGVGAERAAAVALDLIREGHAGRLLLSSGVSRVAQLGKYGGPGYGHLTTAVLTGLREAGVEGETLSAITHDNPLRWLTDGLTSS
ncbi:aryldialkylphosphatase [Nonomuraea sp. C10]|uniref:phosphotriesterase family protein n=1 Tax=Nonomuraea sp. C10 TaxID=2600577 RepID=UPI0021C2A45C|nr:aryldialkylphosphatase [Nonomuraea sp. C10]